MKIAFFLLKIIKNGWVRLGTVRGRDRDGDGRDRDAVRIGTFTVTFDIFLHTYIDRREKNWLCIYENRKTPFFVPAFNLNFFKRFFRLRAGTISWYFPKSKWKINILEQWKWSFHFGTYQLIEPVLNLKTLKKI